MDTVDTSGAALVEFWSRVATRGEMNSNTAASLRAAVKAVLEVEEGWEHLDARSLDIEGLLRRFANKKGSDFKTESLRQYQRRFRQAYDSFLQYAENPAAWTPPAQNVRSPSRRDSKRDGKKGSSTEKKVVTEPSGSDGVYSAQATMINGVEYPFPLRGGGFMAKLRLPTDLTPDEADVLYVFLKAVANATVTKGKPKVES